MIFSSAEPGVDLERVVGGPLRADQALDLDVLIDGGREVFVV